MNLLRLTFIQLMTLVIGLSPFTSAAATEADKHIIGIIKQKNHHLETSNPTGSVLHQNSSRKEKVAPLLIFALNEQKDQQSSLTAQKENSSSAEGAAAFGGGYYLDKAWTSYNKKKYDEAIELFNFAKTFPETELDAKLGLAYSYLKNSMSEKAIPLFSELVKKEYRVKEILPNLMSQLIESGKFKQARTHLSDFQGDEKRLWEEKVEKAYQSHKILEAEPENEAARSTLSVLSWRNYDIGKYEEAHAGFSELHLLEKANKEHALGLAY